MLEAFETHPDAFTSALDERAVRPLSWWEGRLSPDPQAVEVVLGAFHGKELAGVAGLSFATGSKTRHKARLFGMYVPARFAGEGLGRRLLASALATASSRAGVRLVQLTVTEGNFVARQLYERNGFRPFGIEPFAVAAGDGFVSKIHMWRDLGPPRQTPG